MSIVIDNNVFTLSEEDIALSPYFKTLFSTEIYLDKDKDGNIIMDNIPFDSKSIMSYIRYLKGGFIRGPHECNQELYIYMGHIVYDNMDYNLIRLIQTHYSPIAGLLYIQYATIDTYGPIISYLVGINYCIIRPNKDCKYHVYIYDDVDLDFGPKGRLIARCNTLDIVRFDEICYIVHYRVGNISPRILDSISHDIVYNGIIYESVIYKLICNDEFVDMIDNVLYYREDSNIKSIDLMHKFVGKKVQYILEGSYKKARILNYNKITKANIMAFMLTHNINEIIL